MSYNQIVNQSAITRRMPVVKPLPKPSQTATTRRMTKSNKAA